jgi:diketogulonate reductase-like aldo/keto reductase
MQTFEMSNGIKIPAIGYGTWKSPDNEVTLEGIKTAVSCGYRHIDTAAVYGNEVSVGKGIAGCSIPREDLFITSKVWNTERGYEKTLAAFEKTIEDIGVSYLDLYLIHWPAAAHKYDDWEEVNRGTWRAMTELYKAGKIRSIGVSNFKPHHLKALMDTEIKPMVNQIEFHPGYMQDETVQYCRENGILVEAWSPLGNGMVLTNPVLMDMGEKYGRSVAQICLRWCLQHEVLPLSKSVTPSRIEENFRIFDFEISSADMAAIDSLGEFGWSGNDPDKVDF